jgi:hypothetical protein
MKTVEEIFRQKWRDCINAGDPFQADLINKIGMIVYLALSEATEETVRNRQASIEIEQLRQNLLQIYEKLVDEWVKR